MKVNRFMVLEEFYKRNLLNAESDLEKEYLRLKSGFEGEKELASWLKRRLGAESTVLHNLEIKKFNRTQVDLMVLWDNLWWVIEVKNYGGLFKISDKENVLGDWRMPVDQLASMRNRLRIMEELARSVDSQIQVEGSFVMIHPDAEVIMQDEEKFDVLTRNQINRAISRRMTEYHSYSPWKIKRYLHALSQHIDPYPEKIPVLTQKMWEDCEKGVRCPKCDHYLLASSNKMLACGSCGYKGFKASFVLDLFKQLLVLLHDRKERVNAQILVEFSGNLIGRKAICRGLSQHAQIVKKGPASYFKLRE